MVHQRNLGSENNKKTITVLVIKYKPVANLAKKEEVMQSISFRDLKNIVVSPLRQKLTSESVLIITVSNKPLAVMIDLSDEHA